MIQVFIDNQSVKVEKGSTVFQACTKAGVEIPRFCYHERLSIAGNCRMCLVEVEKSPKPVASCAMPVMEGMKIKTNTALVKKAREGVLEFLLINHPLDCPICDQGGECDLQDLTMVYGADTSRFSESKRSVKDKELGPLVKTVMTRCIHCTRCVRFATEIAGVQDLGTVGRGKETEISTYLKKIFDSELSGNVIDLCPVGALTSKPYAFHSRSWEIKSTETIDLSDSLGSNIKVDVRGSSILRILPRLNESINEEWISDKTRFSYDGLQHQRLYHPMIRKNGYLEKVSWQEALQEVLHKLSLYAKESTVAVLGSQVDVESAVVTKEFLTKLGIHQLYFEKHWNAVTGILSSNQLNDHSTKNYLLNQSIPGLEEVDTCLLVGVNPRFEATLVNTRLRKRYLQGNFQMACIGPELNLTYPVKHLGNDINLLLQICEGRHPFSKFLAKTKKSIVILGNHLFRKESSHGIYDLVQEMTKRLPNFNSFNFLHSSAGLTGYLEAGILNDRHVCNQQISNTSKNLLLFSIGSDDLDIPVDSSNCLVYLGHHGDKCASHADIILPCAAFTEKENSTYLTIQGQSQFTKLVFYPPADAKEDWEILQVLSEMNQTALPYQSKKEVQSTIHQMYSPWIYPQGQYKQAKWKDLQEPKWKSWICNDPLSVEVDHLNYYQTDVICRSSMTMAKCIKANFLNSKSKSH
uniref:NADH dehydrogenase subunit 11 n=1 Tax=Jakoba libera TaxID=143017 RepID=M4QDI9_JAKLI|nr:NADH dehydrogenase subunit 11 [Jakoba libera]AGH24220.1 NADH dehydrogenase subunit 11 [Jakoba libera]